MKDRRSIESREERQDRLDEEFVWECLEPKNRKAIKDLLRKRKQRSYLQEAAHDQSST